MIKDQVFSFVFKGRKISIHLRIYNPKGRKTLLAMHGIASTAEEEFDGLSQYLGSDYRVVAPDWLGFGKSTKLLRKQDSYGVDYCSDWYNQFLKNATKEDILPKKFSLISVSMSGIVVAKTYRKNKGRYDKIIFLNPAGLDKKIKRIFAFILSSGMFLPRTVRLIANDFVWKKLKWDSSTLKRLKCALKDGGKELKVFTRYGHSAMTLFGNMRDTDFLPDRFAEIKCPTLLIHSENDEIFYEKGYLDFAKEHGWTIRELKGATHLAIRDKPKGVAKFVNDFLG